MKCEFFSRPLFQASLLLLFSCGTFICQKSYAQQVPSLTLEQEQRILEVNQNANEAIFEEFENLQSLQEQLNALMLSSDAPEDEIREIHQQLQNSQIRISELNFEKNLEIRSILPPELRQPFASALQQGIIQSASEATE